MSANFIDFVTALVYGDMGAAELGGAAPPFPGVPANHIEWTVANIPSSGASTVTGTEFLSHHLDYMFARYEAWRGKYFLPPVRPWDGQDCFPDNAGSPPVGPALPANLNGGPFPGVWTLDDLGDEVRAYYNTLKNFIGSGNRIEFRNDELKGRQQLPLLGLF